MRTNEKLNIEAIGDSVNELYWKNYPNCPIDNKPMEVIYFNSYEGDTCYGHSAGYEIKYRCLHCFHIEWERDGI